MIELPDGRTVQLRPIRPDDADGLAEFHTHLSPETIRRRYFAPHPMLTPTELHRFTNVDGEHRLAIVAELDGQLVGVGRYETLADEKDVEGAWVVRDDHQHLGIGKRLVAEVADQAKAHGKHRLLAETLPENVPMRRALLSAGYPAVVQFRGGVVEVVLTLVDD